MPRAEEEAIQRALEGQAAYMPDVRADVDLLRSYAGLVRSLREPGRANHGCRSRVSSPWELASSS